MRDAATGSGRGRQHEYEADAAAMYARYGEAETPPRSEVLSGTPATFPVLRTRVWGCQRVPLRAANKERIRRFRCRPRLRRTGQFRQVGGNLSADGPDTGTVTASPVAVWPQPDPAKTTRPDDGFMLYPGVDAATAALRSYNDALPGQACCRRSCRDPRGVRSFWGESPRGLVRRLPANSWLSLTHVPPCRVGEVAMSREPVAQPPSRLARRLVR